MVAVILAAGLSRRFHGRKLLETINGKQMVLHGADLVGALCFERKILVYSDEEVRKAVLDNCKTASEFHFLHNSHAEEGLSTSIKLALESLPLKASTDIADGIMFFVGDQPFLDEATVNKLLEAFYQGKGSIIVPLYGNSRGNPVIFSGKWMEQLKKLEGDVGGRTIIRENPGEVWEVPVENSAIGRDIDTKAEWEALHSERNFRLHEEK